MKKYICKAALAVAVLITVVMAGSASDEKTYYKVVEKMGYRDVSTVPMEIQEISIPQNFNKVYQKYNSLLNEGGYDLSAYRGKDCLRYTYEIPSINARANILVYDGEIIGGDISGITLDGIMIPIKRSERYAT